MGFLRSVKNKLNSVLATRDINKYARSLGVTVGNNVRFISVPDFGSEPWLISIGNDVLITGKVTFLTHDGSIHTIRNFSKTPHLCKFGRIEINDRSFIGKNSTIMPNVRIGSDCIIATNSVVTKDIPDGMVAGGCPAKIICSVEELAEKWENNMADYVPLNGEKNFRIWTTHVVDYYWNKKEQQNK